MRLVKPLFIEPLVPFSHWSGQSVLDPHYEGLGYDGPLSSKLLNRGHINMISIINICNRPNMMLERRRTYPVRRCSATVEWNEA
jgi:hypothetical protein